LVYLTIVAGVVLSCAGRLDIYDSKLARVVYEAVVQVLTACANGQGQVGAGVAITDKHVLTARHLLRCGKDGTVEPVKILTRHQSSGQISEVVVDEDGKGIDISRLVVVQGRRPFKTFAPISYELPKIGAKVSIISGAHVRKWGDVVHSDASIVAGIAVVRGNSGSPMYNTRGQLIGIVVGGNLKPHEEKLLQAVSSRAWRSLVVDYVPDLFPEIR
jgi:hypothetical protein